MDVCQRRCKGPGRRKKRRVGAAVRPPHQYPQIVGSLNVEDDVVYSVTFIVQFRAAVTRLKGFARTGPSDVNNAENNAVGVRIQNAADLGFRCDVVSSILRY